MVAKNPGRHALTKEDRYQIQKYIQHGERDYKKIAETLGVSSTAVHNYVTRNSFEEIYGPAKFSTEESVFLADVEEETGERLLNKLHGREYWTTLKNQFTEEEIQTFTYAWIRTMVQFKEDVLPTEEAQIRQLLTLQIFIDRSIQKRKDHTNEVARIVDILDHEYSKTVEKQNDTLIANLEQQLAFLRNSEMSYTKDYVTLLDKYNKMSENLKATRDQRIKHIEDSKTTYSSYIHMLEDPIVRKKLGVDIELQKLAHEKALEDLSQWHQYADGQIDQPILTPETVKGDRE